MSAIKDPASYRIGFLLGLAGFAYPYGKPMPTAYLYPRLVLPELPGYDSTAYPYAVLVVDGDNIVLYCTGSPLELYGYLHGNGDLAPAEDCAAQLYTLIDGEWTYREDRNLAAGNIVVSIPDEFFGWGFYDVIGFVWSNYDIIRTDNGNTILKAYDPDSVQDGMAIYYGAKLPPLPEWNRDAYPYALIVHYDYSETAQLYACSAMPKFMPEGAGSYSDDKIIVGENACLRWEKRYGSAIWENLAEYPHETIANPEMMLWTNTDINNVVDGSLYMQASEPVPIYA